MRTLIINNFRYPNKGSEMYLRKMAKNSVFIAPFRSAKGKSELFYLATFIQ